MHAIAVENGATQGSDTRPPGGKNFSIISVIHVVAFSYGRIIGRGPEMLAAILFGRCNRYVWGICETFVQKWQVPE